MLLRPAIRFTFALSFVLVLLSPRPAVAQDNAAELDGAGDYFYAGLLTPGVNFTIEAWTRLDSISSGQAVVSAANLGDSFNAFYLGYLANSSEWTVELDDDDAFEGDDCPSSNTLCVGVTQSAGANLHIAVVVQGTTMTLYLNGIAVGSEVAATPPVFAGDLWILGAETDGGGFGSAGFIGLLDEVRVWNTARSTADIQCTMNWALTGAESGLYARWDMNETVFALTAADSAGSFDATLFGNPSFVASPFSLTQSVGGDIPCLNSDGDGDGYTSSEGDCNDSDPSINPGATETCNDLDDNCNGVIDEGFDWDGDGFVPCGGLPDCDDFDALIYPGAAEICDGFDSDCDGALSGEEHDVDVDGWFSCDGDCDDFDNTVYPGAAEICNGLDDNCDDQIGSEEFDSDGDGYRPCSGDCDDTNPAINPTATEDCTDGVDNDCDGLGDATDPDCAGDDDDDTTSDDDDTSWLVDDDDSAPPVIERRDGCDCGNEVSGQTGLSLIFALGLIAPWRRKRFRGCPS
jgi:hypothetical protein